MLWYENNIVLAFELQSWTNRGEKLLNEVNIPVPQNTFTGSNLKTNNKAQI